MFQFENQDESTSYVPLSVHGSYYVARLSLSIQSSNINPIEFPLELNKPNFIEFCLFCILSEVTLIDSRYQYGKISFRITIGNKIFFYFYFSAIKWLNKNKIYFSEYLKYFLKTYFCILFLN